MRYLSPSEQLLKDWNFLLSSPEGVGSIFLMVIILLLVIRVLGVELWHWLKGSRVSYFLTYGKLRCDGRAFRTRNARVGYVIDDGALIEISRGLFRRRSAIYGKAAQNWRITGDCAWPNTLRWVYLKDQRGLRIEDALPLINTYPSFQAMLDRIAELEKKLEKAEDFRTEWRAANIAILQLIDIDRQMYRSKSSERIRKWLEAVEQSAKSHGEPEPPKEKVIAWVRGLPLLVVKSD